MAHNENIFDTTDQSFSEDVILKSDSTPILIDFWAPWCGPCTMLSPVLEQLAEHFTGQLLIAKVNTDENPALAQHFQIRGIPALKLIKEREIVFETGGVQPLAALIEAIQPFIDTVQSHNSTQQAEEVKIQAATLSTSEAVEQLEAALAENREDADLQLHYVQALIANAQLEDAHEHYLSLPTEMRETQNGQLTRVFLDFSRARAQAPATDILEQTLMNDPNDLTARYQYGVNKLLEGHHEAALQDFLFILQKDNNYEEELGRKALVAAFALVPDEELVKTYRRKMANYLY